MSCCWASRPGVSRWPGGWPTGSTPSKAVSLPVGTLDITLYRDDLRQQSVRAVGRTEEPPGGMDGRRVVLVDDVLFSGPHDPGRA